jgi:phosphoserine / homoserine phosphotransferase
MQMVCLDLEGVLIPEIWIAFAKKTGIEALQRTTRDEPDYGKLMRYRLDILDQAGLKLNQVHDVIESLDPLPGACGFLDWLKTRGRVVILSDTFEEFAGPLMAKLGHPTLFCHNLIVEADGRIADYQLRLDNHKQKAVEAFRDLNFHVVAVGDSYNDLTMIRAAHQGILFKAPNNVISENPDLPTASTYEVLKVKIKKAGEQ